MAETQHSLRVVKQFTYRGADQLFSNRYYFNGDEPADWDALFDAVTAVERSIYSSEVSIVSAHGYAPGSNIAYQNKNYSLPGTLTGIAGTCAAPGDCAMVARWITTKRSTKNHPVYVFSYWHGALIAGVQLATGDSLKYEQRTAAQAYADDWLNGITVNARTYVRTTPDGHEVTGALVDPWIGHRDFVG